MTGLLVPLVSVLTIIVLLGLSAFFSSSEIAIFSLAPDYQPTDDSSSAATSLQALRSDPHRLLVTILVGNNVVNVAIASLTTALLLSYLPAGIAVTAATIAASFVVLVFGEIVPKSFGLGQGHQWALRVARPLTIIERVLGPLVSIFDALTRGVTAAIGGKPDIETPYLED